MSSLYSLEHYEHEFNHAKVEYQEIMKAENDAAVLMKWMIENSVPMTIFMPIQWQDKFLTLEGLIEVYNQLHWSLYDDGDVKFIKTNHKPIIYFNCNYFFGEQLPDEIEYHTFGLSPMNLKVEGTFSNVFDFMKNWEEVYSLLIKYYKKGGIKWNSWESYKK